MDDSIIPKARRAHARCSVPFPACCSTAFSATCRLASFGFRWLDPAKVTAVGDEPPPTLSIPTSATPTLLSSSSRRTLKRLPLSPPADCPCLGLRYPLADLRLGMSCPLVCSRPFFLCLDLFYGKGVAPERFSGRDFREDPAGAVALAT